MATSIFTLAALTEAGYADMPASELPPFAAFLPGTTGVASVLLAGSPGEVGMVSGMKFATGGFRYTDLPISESAFLLEGAVRVHDDATGDEAVISAGEGFLIPLSWSGTVEAIEPVTKIFHVL